MTPETRAGLAEDIRAACNSRSVENGSDTPDFILAAYLVACLEAYDQAVRERERWWGRGFLGNSPEVVTSSKPEGA